MKNAIYPTKEQILKEPRPDIPNELLAVMSRWKEFFYKGWKRRDIEYKIGSLGILMNTICMIYGKKNPNYEHCTCKEHVDHYNPRTKTLVLGKNISIISAFHELAHHLFGASELTACRWSVWIYKLRFRKDYEKLVWKRHLLVRQAPNSSPTKRGKSR